VIVANEDFGTGTHPTSDRTVAAGSGMSFHTRDGASAITAAIVDDAVFGSKVLSMTDLNSPASTSKPVIGLLPLTLQLANTNDFVTVAFSFRFVNNASVTAAAANFRFGLFNSAGTAVTSDSQTTSDNDRGYYVQVGSSGTTAPTSTNLFYNEGGTILPILASTDRTNVAASSAGVVINNTNIHTAAFTLTRVNATAISLSLVIDGATAITGTDTTSNFRTSFDEIAFSNGFTNPGLNYAIDNVVITSSVPEPNTVGIVAAGALVGAAARRRRS
jgi:hypothetical protein